MKYMKYMLFPSSNPDKKVTITSTNTGSSECIVEIGIEIPGTGELDSYRYSDLHLSRKEVKLLRKVLKEILQGYKAEKNTFTE